MDEDEPAASLEELNDAAAYPMYFGVSCAFVALHLISRSRRLDIDHGRRTRIGETMLQGSAHLLGLLLARAQRRGESLGEKLSKAESEVGELKRRRAEDAKANEKVVGIFATHEQSWIAERKRLRIQIQALHVVKAKHEEEISDLNTRVDEGERRAEEEAENRKEIEEKLRLSEEVAEELRERAKKEAQDHSSELWKHKTKFVELVSNQRQLEAELGRALRQVEAAKQELDEMSEQKEEAESAAEKISGEIVKLQKDAEQKDRILSAMLRKSKLDTAEKQMLLKEVKISKAKKKQAQLDSEKWRNISESNHKNSSRKLKSFDAGSSEERRPELRHQSSEKHRRTLLLEYFEAENRKELEPPSTPKGENIVTAVNCLDHYSSDEADEQAANYIQKLQCWVRLETEKYATILEERHYAEVEAFTEQMRHKDEKLEAFRWQLQSMELESKRLQSQIEWLDGNLSRSSDENLKLETLLSDREEELKSLKEQLNSCVQHCQESNSKATGWALNPLTLCSEVKTTMKESTKEEEQANYVIQDRDDQYTHEETTATSSADFTSPAKDSKDYSIIYVDKLSSEESERTEDSTGDQAHSTTQITRNPREEIEEERELSMDPIHAHKRSHFHEKTEIASKSDSLQKTSVTKDSSWKMDIHALGVAYKIKRLKQQLLVLEKLAAAQGTKQSIIKDDAPDGSKERKAFPLVMSLLNKQVKRYESLEEKADELCRKMHESYRTGSSRDAHNGRPKEQIEMLGRFLEETFQLQRYMVATGQKLMEIQSRITFSFGGDDGLDESAGFNKRQFADIVRSLFREIQRGLEVRISRIIGDLEGTLASDGILRR